MEYENAPSSETLERIIERQILRLTNGQIRSLAVFCHENQVVIRGIARSYYQKQLALQGTLDAIRDRDGLKIELQIEVRYA